MATELDLKPSERNCLGGSTPSPSAGKEDTMAIMVHLWHPCREIDVWVVTTDEDKRIALSQGYLDLDDIREKFEDNYPSIHSIQCDRCGRWLDRSVMVYLGKFWLCKQCHKDYVGKGN